jgi:hypothetical protein
MWQQNLLNNLIVVFVLLALAAIIYCKVKKITMVELFKEIKEIISPSEVAE